MTRLTPALCALALLLSVAAGGHAEEVGAPKVSMRAAETWTRYDWNTSSGTGRPARFETLRGGVLHIAATVPNDARFVRRLAVEPSALYRLACRIRTEGVGPAAKGAWISVSGILDGSPDIHGTTGWRVVELYGRAGPGQRGLSITVGVGGYGSLNSGSAWFDAVTVEKALSVPLGVSVASLEPPSAAATPAHGPSRSGWLFGALGGLGLLLMAAGLRLRRETRGPGEQSGEESPHRRPDRTDVALMTAMTVICLAVSLWHLGGHAAPETGWVPSKAGDAVTIELGRDAELSRIYYYCGINEAGGDGSRFRLAARTPEGNFVPVASFTKDDVGTWKYAEVDVRTSAVRLTADTPGGRLNELAFVEKGKRAPLAGLRLGETTVSAADQEHPGNLIDEQRAFEYTPSFRTGFHFDEVYHARSAWEMLHGIEPFETTHPPLGKLFIAAGIRLFGMNAFGWRFAGTVFGAALVPLLYVVGLKLFRSRFWASCAALLLLADFMRFAQTRVAVIDVYGVFFILLMYFFLLDLFPDRSSPPRRADGSLLLAGVAFGLGAASKWIALYAGGGAALLITLRTVADVRRSDLSGRGGAIGFLARRAAVCLVAFGAIPAFIYLLSYLPYLSLPGPGHDVAGVLRLQAHMLDYHRTLQATHPFSSPWWSWPLDLHPVWMYQGLGLPKGTVSSIASFGNPVVWWPAIPSVAGAAALALRRRDPRLGVALTAFAFQYLPWVGVHRLAFIYHFFSAVPFAILCTVALLQAAERRWRGVRALTWAYLGISAALFVAFYPVLSGLEVGESYVAALRWLPTWIF